MKKTVKSSLLVAVLAILLLALTGCGGNKLVATKSESNELFGKYEEKIEITFKKDKVDKVVMTMEFENEDKAKGIAALYNMSKDEDMKDIKVEQKGKKLVMTMDAKAFTAQEGNKDDDSSLTKESIKKSLEEAGYKVK